MTVGYRIAGGTDLDSVFKARTSAAIANVGYRDSSGVDLSQRYEPRGATTPVANTGYRNSAGTDLAQLFMNAAVVAATGNLNTAFNSGRTGYSDGNIDPGIVIGSWTGTMPPNTTASALFSHSTVDNWFGLKSTVAQSWCANVDSVWTLLEITGIFTDSAGATVTRSISRSACTYSVPSPASGFFFGKWVWTTGVASFQAGAAYTTKLYW